MALVHHLATSLLTPADDLTPDSNLPDHNDATMMLRMIMRMRRMMRMIGSREWLVAPQDKAPVCPKKFLAQGSLGSISGPQMTGEGKALRWRKTCRAALAPAGWK